jgi:hypothetical protein
VTRNFARLAVVVLLVASTFAVASTGTVAASQGDLECAYEFEIFGNVYTLGQCEYTEPDYEAQSTASYSADSLANALVDDSDRLKNSIEAYRTLAYREAEAAFARSMANGSSKSDAQVAADEAVTKYVAGLLQNQHAAQTNGYASEIVALQQPDGVTVKDNTGDFRDWSVKSENVTVFPSSSESREISVSYIQSHHYNDNTTFKNATWNPELSVGTTSSFQVTYTSPDYNNDNFDSEIYLWENRWNEIKSIRGEVVNEISTFANNVNASEYENISPEDIPSPVTQATEFGQSYNDTGSSGYASALSAALGFSSDVGTTYHVELLADGTHYNGTLYADASAFPNSTIERGTVYDGANQTVWLNPNSGDEFGINQDYKVHNITLSDGNTTNSTEFSNYTRTSLDETAPIDTLNKWLELRKEAGVSGSGGVPLGNNMMLLLGGGLVLLAGYVYTKDDDGNGGGGTTVIGMGGGDDGSGGS